MLENIAQVYNNSPLGKCSGNILSLVGIFIKLMGINTDHCAKEKKDAKLLEAQKAWAVD